MIAPRPRGAPSPGLPLRYLAAAAGAFLLGAPGVAWLAGDLAGHYYHPRVVALTHTLTLGWITLAILGASFQLIPVVLERPIWSERLGRWQFWWLLAGMTGMIGHFYIGSWPGLLWAAVITTGGLGAQVLNVALSLRGFRRWTFTARLIALAYGGILLTAAFGITLGADRIWRFLPTEFFPTLHAHFHLGLLLWVAPTVMGVAARVYPMFLLAPEPGGWPGALQLWGLALGGPAVILGLLGLRRLLLPGALAVAAAAAAHGLWVLSCVRRRKRPALDWGLRLVLTGAAFLAPAILLGVGFAAGLLSGPRLGLAYAVVTLGGWVSLTIAGMMLKIVPFLVWYRVYGRRAGRVPVPTLAQLSWPAAERGAYALLVGGIIVLGAAAAAGDAAWIRAAGMAVAAGAGAFGAALARVLAHLTANGGPAEGAVPLGPAGGPGAQELGP